jgi:signal transduction histidine kinase
VSRRLRPPGLQVWLVAALIGVGALASLAVLLSVLPAFESSLRGARATALGRDLAVGVSTVDTQVLGGMTRAELARAAAVVEDRLGAQVRITVEPTDGVTRTAPSSGCCELLDELGLQGVEAAGGGFGVAPGNRAVLVVSQRPLSERTVFGAYTSTGTVTIEAAQAVPGISSDELENIQRRLILAVAAVLTLAALAGYGLTLLVGRRISTLARTASQLAAGDLAARAPEQGLREFATLGDSLNTMAGRIENQVDQITGERDRARVLISSLAEGVVAIADDGQVTILNPAAKRLLGMPPGARLGTASELPPPLVRAVAEASSAGEDPAESETVLADGTELQVVVARLAAPAAGVVLTLRDVTEQRRLERARRDLVANVSHELKTPLAALKGLIELLQSPRVDRRHRDEFLGLMDTEAGRLERLVEEQLQLARLDSGALPLEREDFDLDALAEGVVASRRALAETEGIALRAIVGDPVPVRADGARVEQILLILLDNALRHTPPGGTVEVRVGRDGGDATLAVADTGDGIPAAEQPFVFDRFYRGDRSREGRSAGLGLAIARGLATAHGGAIELVSAPGAGSTFTLRLPAAPAAAPGAPPPPGRLAP